MHKISLKLIAAAFCPLLVLGAGSAGAAALPSGQRVLNQSILEPVYNDAAGTISYIKTPIHAPMHANPTAWAPLYVVVYPLGVSMPTLNCMHVPVDNCPDHGPGVAAAAEALEPSVYGGGVLGHDHLIAVPGSGGDFNIAWEPILVLFTNHDAATHHLTSEAQVNAAVSAGDATEVPVPSLTFNCAVVPGGLYARGTPVTG
jgi:hypothetical protein